jgi:hypothetical protein
MLLVSARLLMGTPGLCGQPPASPAPAAGNPSPPAAHPLRTFDSPVAHPLPTLDEVLASRLDLWGRAARTELDGPSYEFFESLLPPPRYVHADFRDYPLVLSAPLAATKARLISSGRGINLRGGSRSWKDVGVGVVFRVGPDEVRFGELPDRLSEPQPADGWLPIYTIQYRHPQPLPTGSLSLDGRQPDPLPEVYALETFATTQPPWAEEAVVFCQFSLAQGRRGVVTVQFETPGQAQFLEGKLADAQGRTVVWLGPGWRWERQGAHADVEPGRPAVLAVFTRPTRDPLGTLDQDTYAAHREATAATWRQWLARGAQLELPEPRVAHAYKTLLVQNLMIARGDQMLYSVGNQYEALYEAEGSDAVLAMMMWGYEDLARQMIVPLLDFTRRGLENHQASHKLQMIIRYYWQTRDVATLAAWQPRWQRELDRLRQRDPATGLLPKERYCGDVATPVHSLAVEAKAWRALADLPPVLRAMGRAEDADALARDAAALRQRLQQLVRDSARHQTDPPFVPIALLAHEATHDPITATRLGSYWNLMANYVIGARLFPAQAPEADWLPRYLETHGGLCMGMTRSGGFEQGFWTGPHRVNPLYGTRYVLDLLHRDEVDAALVGFYGMLAQGMTRQTFVAGEGISLTPLDARGRFFYCPPNTAANAHVLAILRHLLVQEVDADEDGRPDTLRLLPAIPRRWLADGQRLAVRGLATAFGPVSLQARSELSRGHVEVEVDLPQRERPKQVRLRARVPAGWQVRLAQVAGRALPVDAQGTVDLPDREGTLRIRFEVVPSPAP